MAADARLIAVEGPEGLAIPLAAFRERAGGEAAVRKFLRALTVTEKLVGRGKAGRPAARAARAAYKVVRAPAAAAAPAGAAAAAAPAIPAGGLLVIPRVKGAPFLRARGPGGRPLIDAIEVAPRGATRAIPADACAAEEPLYDYQEAAVRFVCLHAGEPVGAPAPANRTVYLQMDTGLGKTRVGCAVIAHTRAPALVVVPTEAIAYQWLDELAASYPGLRGGLYRNEDERRAEAARGRARAPVPPAAGPATHDLVVVIVNTFRDKTPEFVAGFHSVILDEAHELHSTHNSRALWLAQAPLVLGLSATPLERPDGLDRYVAMHLGAPVPLTAVPGCAVAAVRFRGEVRLVEYAGPVGAPECETVVGAAGAMSAVMTIGRVLSDPARRRLVAAEVRRLLRAHEELPADERARAGLGPRPPEAATPALPAGGVRRHGVFVFAELREALPALRAELERALGEPVLAPELDGIEAGVGAGVAVVAAAAGAAAGAATPAAAPAAAAAPPAMPISILRGGVARDAVSNARALKSHVVLTTYGFSRRGISLPDMTALVLASPRRNGSTQTLGRILRRGSDESILRVVVDIVDVATGLKGQAAERKRAYAGKGWPVTRVQVSHAEYALAAAGAADAVGADTNADPTDDELIAAAMPDLNSKK